MIGPKIKYHSRKNIIMTFEKITNNAPKNFLTDGQITCYYNNLPSLLESINQYFSGQNISLNNHFAFECSNSVFGALIALYLLKHGSSFVLLPPQGHQGKGPDFKPSIPKFCQYRLAIKPFSKKNQPAKNELFPENFLAIEENEQYKNENRIHLTEKLYIRTSGSMGASKLVVHSHTKLLQNALNCVKRYQLESDDRVVIPIPIFHLYGFGAGLLAAISVGASVDIQDNSNILKYLQRERQFDPNVAFLTPSLCEMLVRGKKNDRAYKVVITSGERIKEDTFRAFNARFGGRLVSQYGSTEMGATAACEPDDSLELRVKTIGKPMSNVQLKIEESQDNGEYEPGTAELWCQHDYGFEGYIDENGQKLSDASAAAWFNTGDLAKINPNGYIEVIGRAKNSINRSGFLVLFSDIEKAIEKLEQIKQVVVIAAKGEEKRGQRIVAFCMLEHKNILNASQIREACFDILPKYAIPDSVQIVNTLPTLPNGKVDRQTLVKMAG
jgi:acyl-CoA synthetase (AMP-forming)/AMP-acid ligase II